MANLHIIHLTLEFKYESRIGLTMLMKTHKTMTKPLCNQLNPKNASKLDQNSIFVVQIEELDLNAS